MLFPFISEISACSKACVSSGELCRSRQPGFLAGAVGETQGLAKIIGDHQFGAFQVPVPEAVALSFQGKTPAFLAGFQAFKQGAFFGDVAHRHQGLRPVIVFLAGELDVSQKAAAIETPVPLRRQKLCRDR